VGGYNSSCASGAKFAQIFHFFRKNFPMAAEQSELILRRAVAGDSQARRDLLNRFRPLMRLVAARHARRVLSHRFDESDLVQITCLEAFKSFKQFAGGSMVEFQSWLEAILERQMLGQWRRHTAQKRDFRRESRDDELDTRLSFVWAGGRSPAEELISGEVALILADALERLDADYRVVLEMRFIDQRKIREIAEHLQVSTGVVAGRLRRGLEHLQQLLPVELRELLEG